MTEILDNIFGSKARLRLMRFFVLNPDKELTTKELKQKINVDGRTILSNLRVFMKIGLIKSVTKKRVKYYTFNEAFPYYSEFHTLFTKANTEPQCKELSKLSKIGKVKLVVIGGIFSNYSKARMDVLVVSDGLDRDGLLEAINSIEAEIGKEVRYMTLTSKEFNYRLDMMDRFIIEFFTSPHKILLNKLAKVKGFIISVNSRF